MKCMKKRIIYIVSGILIILIVVLLKAWTTKKPTLDELLFEVPEMEEGLSRNDKIKFAFDSFALIAKKTDFEDLCSGGFINEDKKRLKEIASIIVENRMTNPYPLEFAANQDEAGIACLSNTEKWVLFSALNQEDESTKNYFCTDSTGRKGHLDLSRERLTCK
jgi:hypothetical protein